MAWQVVCCFSDSNTVHVLQSCLRPTLSTHVTPAWNAVVGVLCESTLGPGRSLHGVSKPTESVVLPMGCPFTTIS